MNCPVRPRDLTVKPRELTVKPLELWMATWLRCVASRCVLESSRLIYVLYEVRLAAIVMKVYYCVVWFALHCIELPCCRVVSCCVVCVPCIIYHSLRITHSNSYQWTSVFDISPLNFPARSDRYNHELETDDDDDDDEDLPEFSHFSTCSPRYSRICSSSGPTSPVSSDEVRDREVVDVSKESSTGQSDRSSESSPPAVRRTSLKKKISDSHSESRESDDEQPRERSDSGISRDLTRQTSSSSSSTTEYVLFDYSFF